MTPGDPIGDSHFRELVCCRDIIFLCVGKEFVSVLLLLPQKSFIVLTSRSSPFFYSTPVTPNEPGSCSINPSLLRQLGCPPRFRPP